jgi:hypothetical protein
MVFKHIRPVNRYNIAINYIIIFWYQRRHICRQFTMIYGFWFPLWYFQVLFSNNINDMNETTHLISKRSITSHLICILCMCTKTTVILLNRNLSKSKRRTDNIMVKRKSTKGEIINEWDISMYHMICLSHIAS